MYYNNKRLALSVFWVVLGAALLVLSIAEVLDSSIYAGDERNSFLRMKSWAWTG